MANAVGVDGVAEGLRNLALADELREVLRTVAAGDDDVLRVAGRIFVRGHWDRLSRDAAACDRRRGRSLAEVGSQAGAWEPVDK